METIMKNPELARQNPQRLWKSVCLNLRFVACAWVLVALATISVSAADGVWINNASGTWGTAANWSGGTIADGADFTANFRTINISADRTVTLNTARTIGHLAFGDNDGTPESDWILAASGGSVLTLAVTAGTPTILVSNQIATISLALAGSQGFTKTGVGELVLSGVSIFTGDVAVQQGSLRIGGGNNRLPTATTVTLGSGSSSGKFILGDGTARSQTLAGLLTSGTGTANAVVGGDNNVSTLTLNIAGINDYSGILGGGLTDENNLALVKTGTGTLTLSGTSANTFTGDTTVNAGTLILNKTAVTAVSGNLIVGDGTGTDTVQLGGNNQIANGSTVTVNSSGVLDLNNNSDTVGNTTVVGGSITTGGGALTIGTLGMTAGSIATGTGSLTLGGAVTGNASANSATISGNLNLGGTTRTFTIADGGAAEDMAISANISNGGLTKAGTGLLALSGANTYTGFTTNAAGVLLLNSAGALGSGNLRLSGGVVGLGAEDFTLSLGTGSGQVQFVAGSGGGWAAYGADRLVNLGNSSAPVTWNSGGFVLTGDALILGASSATHSLDFQNPINLNAGTREVQVADGSALIDAILSGTISGTGASVLNKTGAGALLLNGNNTFAGGLTVSGGTLVFGTDTAPGLGTLTLTAGVTLQGSGGTRTITNNLSVASVTFSGSEALIFTDSFDQGGARTYTVDNTTTFSGAITGGDNLSKSGTGTLILSGNNAIDTVTVNNGALRAANNGALGSTAFGTVVNSGGALELIGGIAVGAEGLSLNGTGVGNGGALRNISGNNSWAGTITLQNVTGVHRVNSDSGVLAITGGITETGTANDKNLTFGGAGRTIVSGNITADAGDMLLTKDGTGTVTLTGTNTYTGGTSINGGTLLVNNTGGSGTGTGAVNVNNTGTLGGTGIVGSVTNNSGGTISPGNSIGVLETGSETWKGGSTFLVEINDVDAGAGIGHDAVDINGFLNITASSGDQAFISVASLTLGNAPGAVHDWDPTQSYIWTIATTISGLSFLPAEDETTVFQLLLGDFTAYNDVQGGVFSLEQSGNNLNLIFTPVPEPGTLALMLLGLGALMRRRSRIGGKR